MVVGVIRSARKNPQETFSKADLELLEGYADQIAYLLV